MVIAIPKSGFGRVNGVNIFKYIDKNLLFVLLFK